MKNLFTEWKGWERGREIEERFVEEYLTIKGNIRGQWATLNFKTYLQNEKDERERGSEIKEIFVKQYLRKYQTAVYLQFCVIENIYRAMRFFKFCLTEKIRILLLGNVN